MSEDAYIRAKKMERENKIAKLDRDKSIFEGISWKNILLLFVSIILEIAGALAFEYFFAVFLINIWILIGALLVITIIGFCLFEYFKNKPRRRVRSNQYASQP